MISPTFATIILVSFLVVFGLMVPIVESTKRFKKAISLRWCVVVVVLALLLGCVLDFAGLDSESRRIVLIGGLIIVGGFVALRTVEKLFSKGFIGKKAIKVKAQKGDMSAELDIGGQDGGGDAGGGASV